jgi:hypothetical protein
MLSQNRKAAGSIPARGHINIQSVWVTSCQDVLSYTMQYFLAPFWEFINFVYHKIWVLIDLEAHNWVSLVYSL